MIKDDKAPQEQSAQEETDPKSLDHDDLEGGELENVSGGSPADYVHVSIGCHPN
jgi:hypothetical protein